MPENLTTKQFVDLETGRPVSNPCYIGDVYDADGADAVLRLFGRDKTRDVTGRVGDYRFTDDSILAPNHLWADGSPIDPVAWPELHAYAARLGWPADAQGHFLLPDLRGKFLVGADGRDADFAAGAEGGAKTVALTSANNGPHTHGLSVAAPYAQPASAVGGMSLGDAGVARETISSGKGIPFSILPPYRAVYVQIRAKPDPVVAQEVTADRLSTPRKIGNADFDGSVDITLEQVGAAASALNIVSLSNSLAEYGTKLQMEWGTIKLQDIEVNNPLGSVFTRNVSSLTFPSPFAAPPVLLTSWDSAGSYVGVAAVGVSATGVTHFTIYRGASATVSGRINYLAIGQKATGG